MTDRADHTPSVRVLTGESSLVRAVGSWGLAAAIINVTIGAGIFRLPSSVAGSLGAAAPAAYIVCALAMGLIVLCFAEAGSRVAMTGGPYAYVEVALGPFVGFVSGVLLWAGLTAALAAVTSFFADSVAALFPVFAGRAGRALFMLVVLEFLALLNVRGVRGANRFNVVMTVAKLLPLALLVVIGAFAVQRRNLEWVQMPTLGAVGRASALLIFAFLGVEAALVPSGEVRDPARTVPRAVLGAIGAIALLYISVQLVSQGILGSSLAGAKTPLADAAARAFGGWGRTLILVGSSVSMFGYVSGMTLAVPRMLFAFARDGFLPRALAAVHPRYRTPHHAIVVQATIVTILAATGSFERLALIANGSVLLVYAACCVATADLRRRDVRSAVGAETGGVPFEVPAAGVVPWLALGIIIGLLATLQLAEWAAVVATVVVAGLVYAIARWRRRAVVVEPVGS